MRYPNQCFNNYYNPCFACLYNDVSLTFGIISQRGSLLRLLFSLLYTLIFNFIFFLLLFYLICMVKCNCARLILTLIQEQLQGSQLSDMQLKPFILTYMQLNFYSSLYSVKRLLFYVLFSLKSSLSFMHT